MVFSWQRGDAHLRLGVGPDGPTLNASAWALTARALALWHACGRSAMRKERRSRARGGAPRPSARAGSEAARASRARPLACNLEAFRARAPRARARRVRDARKRTEKGGGARGAGRRAQVWPRPHGAQDAQHGRVQEARDVRATLNSSKREDRRRHLRTVG